MSTAAPAGTPFRENDASYLRDLRDRRLAAWRAELATVAPRLIPIIVSRWARVAAALVAGLMCVPRDLLIVAGLDWPRPAVVIALYAGPVLLVPLVWGVARIVVRRRLERRLAAFATPSDDPLADLARLDRRAPARWLAERAGRAERPASVAALVQAGLVPALVVAALLGFGVAAHLLVIVAILLGWFVVLGAWVQPIILVLALSFERRAEAGTVALLVLLALVSLGTTFGRMGARGLAVAAIGALGLVTAALLGRAPLRRRLAHERRTIAALVGRL